MTRPPEICVGTVDSDGDGVYDNCPDLCEGFDDNLDADGDGIPDGCDPCYNPGGAPCLPCEQAQPVTSLPSETAALTNQVTTAIHTSGEPTDPEGTIPLASGPTQIQPFDDVRALFILESRALSPLAVVGVGSARRLQ